MNNQLSGSSGDPEVIDEIIRTLRASGEAVGRSADGVVDMFFRDPSTVLFDYLRPGLTTLEQLHETAEGLVQAQVTFSYPHVAVRQLTDDVALSLAYSQTEIVAVNGSVNRVNNRVTDVWQRLDGKWFAVHEHASVPVDLDTGAAILDAPTA